MRFSCSTQASTAFVCNSAQVILQRWSHFVIDGKMTRLPKACMSSYRRHPDYVTARQLCLIRTRQFSSEPAPPCLARSLVNGWIPIWLSPFSCQTGYSVLTQTRAPFLKLYVGISGSLNLRSSILGRHRLCSSPSVGESYILHMFRFTANPKVLVQEGEFLPEPLPFSICQQCFFHVWTSWGTTLILTSNYY